MKYPSFHGCGCFILIVIIALAFIAWQANAQPNSNIYIQQLLYTPNTGIAWHSGTQQDLEKLQSYYWYGCCNTCPDPFEQRIPIIRPNWQWSSDCNNDYDGYILMGNENEFAGSGYQTPTQMKNWLVQKRSQYQQAIFVCLNSYDIQYMLDVIELLPVDTCDIYGIHTPAGLQDISNHLDQLCLNCRIWITEMYGYNNIPDAYNKTFNPTTEALADPRVERIFLYTARNAHVPALNAVETDGSLFDNGLGFGDAIKAYP